MKKITTLITGASSGIGKALAYECADHGENLVLVARRIDFLWAIQQSIQTQHPELSVMIIEKDLSELWAAQALYENLSKENIEVTHLINNAGFGDYSDFILADWEKLNEMITLNITTLTHLTHLFLPAMQLAQTGRIMNVASTAAFQPGPGMAVYYATKSYVLSISEALAEELHGTGLTVTALCPGPTRSGFQTAAGMTDSALVKNRKLPTSEDVAHYGYHAMMAGKVVAIYGWSNWLLVQLTRFTPRWLVRKMIKKIQSKRR